MTQTTPTQLIGKFEAALQLVRVLDFRLSRGEHLRDTAGRALVTLDQVVLAILENRWPGEGVTTNGND
jgi:hypothetical protein